MGRAIIVPNLYALEHLMRIYAFDAGVGAAGTLTLAVMQIADASLLGGASGIGEQLGVAGLVAITVAIMLLRKEVNRILKAIDGIHALEERISKLEGRLETGPVSLTGRHRRRVNDTHED